MQMYLVLLSEWKRLSAAVSESKIHMGHNYWVCPEVVFEHSSLARVVFALHVCLLDSSRGTVHGTLHVCYVVAELGKVSGCAQGYSGLDFIIAQFVSKLLRCV